jgi:LacI family transcriptional regulator
LLSHLSVSRSWLERNFRKLLNRSPQAEIRMVQIKRCKELLRTTNLSLEKIAGLAGFEHPEYMSVVFKRETGRTPGQYRSNGAGSHGGNGKGTNGDIDNGGVAVEVKKRNGVGI